MSEQNVNITKSLNNDPKYSPEGLTVDLLPNLIYSYCNPYRLLMIP